MMQNWSSENPGKITDLLENPGITALLENPGIIDLLENPGITDFLENPGINTLGLAQLWELI